MKFLILTRWGFNIRKDYPEYYEQFKRFDIKEEEMFEYEVEGSKSVTTITLNSLEDLLFVTETVKGQIVLCFEKDFCGSTIFNPEKIKKYEIIGSIEIYDDYRE